MKHHIETTKITEKSKPLDTTHNVDETKKLLRMSGTLAAVGGISGLAGYFILEWSEVVALAVPIVGAAGPWLVQFGFDAEEWLNGRASIRRRQRIVALQETAAIRDLNGDGVIDNTDFELQRQYENELVYFVNRVWLMNESHTLSHWRSTYGIQHDRWKPYIDDCVDAGILSARQDDADRRHTTRVPNVSYDTAIIALSNANKFKATRWSDHVAVTGKHVKDGNNSVASDGANSYDGPVTTLDL